MDGMREFMDESSPPPLKPWLRESALKAQADVLTPGALRPSWAPRHVAHHGAYVYVLETGDSTTYLSSFRLGRGTRVAAVAPERVGGAMNVIAVFDANVPLAVVAESRRALVLRMGDAAGARAWLSTLQVVNRRITETTTQTFSPGLMTDLLSLDDYGPSTAEPQVRSPPPKDASGGEPRSPGAPQSPGEADGPFAEATPQDIDRTGMSVVAEVGALNMLIGGSAAVVPSAPSRPQWGAPGEVLLLRWQGRMATMTWQSSRTRYTCSMALRQLRVEDALCGGLFLTSSAAAVDGAPPPPSPRPQIPARSPVNPCSIHDSSRYISRERTHAQTTTRTTSTSSTPSSPSRSPRTGSGVRWGPRIPPRTRRRRQRPAGWRR